MKQRPFDHRYALRLVHLSSVLCFDPLFARFSLTLLEIQRCGGAGGGGGGNGKGCALLVVTVELGREF